MAKDKQLLMNPRSYVPNWYRMRENQNTLESADFDSLWLDYVEDVKVLNKESKDNDMPAAKPCPEKDMLKAYNEHLKSIPLQRLKDQAALMATAGEDLAPLRAWVKAVTGDEDELDVAVVAHWIWMVKRRAGNARVIHHIMPVVYGPQGCGKTEAIKKLLEFVEPFKLNARMGLLADENSYSTFAVNLVVLFDELTGVQSVDMNALKNQITTDTNSYRMFYKQERKSVPMRTSFIGATNKPLDESFFDPTGMRRFYQLNALPKCDWAAVNAISSAEIWTGVDEHKESGYLFGDLLQAAANRQALYVNQDDIDLYIEQHNLVAPANGPTKTVEAGWLYAGYTEWAKAHGVKYPLSFIMYNKKLKNRGVHTYLRADSRKVRVRYFDICVTSPVLSNATVASQPLEFKVVQS